VFAEFAVDEVAAALPLDRLGNAAGVEVEALDQFAVLDDLCADFASMFGCLKYVL